MTDNPRRHPFDEQAALAELERLREAIEAARRAREGASEEFERFVRGFRNAPPEGAAPAKPEPAAPEPQQSKPSATNIDSIPSLAAPLPPTAVAKPQPVSEPVPVPEAVASPGRPTSPEPAAVPEPAALPGRPTSPEPAAVPEPAALPERPTSPEPAAVAAPASVPRPAADAPAAAPHAPVSRSHGWIGAVVVGALVVVAAIAWAVLGTRGNPSPTQAPTTARQEAPPVVERSAPAPTPQSTPAAPVKAAAVSLELTAVNPVWVRVIVDGEKKLEDTIPAGQRLQFSGDRSIVVRAGSGGDLMVRSDGREERFGEAGQPLTRTFAPSEESR